MRALIISDDSIQIRISASSIPRSGVLPLIPIQVQYIALGLVQPRRSTNAHYVAASRHVDTSCWVDTRNAHTYLTLDEANRVTRVAYLGGVRQCNHSHVIRRTE
jgi:hypothetical protein